MPLGKAFLYKQQYDVQHNMSPSANSAKQVCLGRRKVKRYFVHGEGRSAMAFKREILV
jgi:hypothetical protein